MAKANAAKNDVPKTDLSTRVSSEADGGELMIVSDQVPDHLKGAVGGTRGNENVKTEDLVVPRLEVVQAISEAMDASAAGYIEGAKVGDLINSVTNEIYGREIFVVPVMYIKQYLVWKDRKAGGGFFGAFPDQMAAQERADEEGGKSKQVEVIDTPTHLCLLLNRNTGRTEEIMISMPRTKAKISRQWNSMVKLAGGDRFTRAYRVGTAQEKNAKGTFANFTITQSGFPSKSVYAQAEALYNLVKSGAKTFTMDTKGFNPGEDGEGDPGKGSEM